MNYIKGKNNNTVHTNWISWVYDLQGGRAGLQAHDPPTLPPSWIPAFNNYI